MTLFNSGYAANCGCLPSLAGPADLIVSDELNHASIIDACRLSRARIEIYRHADAEDATRALRLPARRKLLITDAIFSMDGDRAPLRELARACAREGAILAVDEAHATGVLVLEHRAELRMATHSKALGVVGAHVAASRALCDLLVNRARPVVYSTALPAALARATLEAVRIASSPEGDERRAQLWRNVTRFAAGLRAVGLPAREQSPIFPLLVGAPEKAVQVATRLRERGIFAKAIRPPTVPAGTSRIRFALTAAHNDAHLDAALSALRSAC